MYLLIKLKDRIINNLDDYMQCISLAFLVSTIAVFLINYDYTQNKDSLLSKSAKWTWGCVYKTNVLSLQSYSLWSKSSEYLPLESKETNDEYRKTCFVTRWHMLHFVLHIIVAFVYPKFVVELIMTSTLFEIYEYFSCNCHDITDIFYNVTGALIGYYLRKSLTT